MKPRNFLTLLLLLLGTTVYSADRYHAYLFTYFVSNADQAEAIRFAISYDGFNYRALNDDRPVLDPVATSRTGGVRDPHILRCEDGETFYMVVTDMVAANGWESNRGMVLLKSTDLLNWTHSTVHIPSKKYKGYRNLKRVWAPQTIYDREAGKYMIYWSMKFGDGPDTIYYAYANEDFTDIEGEPQVLFMPANGKACIDGDIVEKDGLYHMFYKTEGHGDGIKKATTRSLTSGVWEEYDRYLQQTDKSVEGSCVFRLIDSDTYILMYDVYRDRSYQFCESIDLLDFTVVDHAVSMDFHPRHGTVIPITAAEAERLERRWGNARGRTPFVPDQTVGNNPVIRDYHADPAVLYSRNTGKYYIYPTTDGYENWGGTSFKAFSSDDLVVWRDEGTILDLPSQVRWADRNAWAPCIIEREIDGRYRYFFYFTAAQKIGVATSDSPTGPFTDSGRPIVGEHPEGITRGQVIDPDVFYDHNSGKYYLYWGNGFLAAAELSDDMLSIKPETQSIITPSDKTFREAVSVFYRGGVYYFLWSENDTRDEDYRVRYGTSFSPLGPIYMNGNYPEIEAISEPRRPEILSEWSDGNNFIEIDYNPFPVPDDNLILAKDPAQGIYGTGHNSVLNIPGTDEWVIVYHRFKRPEGIEMGRSAGYHREVCIDKLEFDSNGLIVPVTPTQRGYGIPREFLAIDYNR
ncbi:MAG: family 43 glycosylhydrolase [Rikenellaceae bacterium]|nr:family 43 glycosylhydrolase [Rikenellaceae bacterium]